MTTIYKYVLQAVDYQEVEMPSGARILSVQNQYDEIVIWAKVFTTAEPERRQIHIFGTGSPLPEMAKLMYIGSVHQPPFVWHVFEEPK